MFMIPGGERVCASENTCLSLTMARYHIVIAMTVGASRMYLGLINGTAFETHSVEVPSN
jgi:hypothetical protein